ncbi:hypothetical protein [Fischerella sp. PCC 9605]|uniref:hypothetical protein n=1 Tax=Fischerella sp. PCC 9605 TaxID=1173024 RepID=UPI00047DD608|nr:hypothetical protein [Fischerella sp. PCC 9605]
MPMTVKELIEALQQCHPDAQVFFSVDFESSENGPIAVEHEVMWRREKGDTEHPGKVYLHNKKSHFFNPDGTAAEGNFMLT